ncbi:DNA mismatch repair protein, partial [Coemansia sp. RSA 2703]
SSLATDTGAIELVRDDSSFSVATVIEVESPLPDAFARTPVLAPDRTRGVAKTTSNLSDIASSPLSEKTRGRLSTLDRSASGINQSFVSSTPQKTPVSRTVRTDYKNMSLDSFMFGSSPSIKRGRVQSTIETDFSVTPIKQTPTRVPFKISPSHANTATSPRSDRGDELFALSRPSVTQESRSDITLMSENVEPPLVGVPMQIDAVSPSRIPAPRATLQSQMSDIFPEMSTATTSRSYISSQKEPLVDVRLTSILNLRKELKRQLHPEMTQILNEHTFVGFVDDRRALIQHQTRLYMADFCKISFHLFHHRIIFDIMNYGRLILDPPAPIRDLALVAARELGNPANADEIADQIFVRFGDNREMLEEYFHIQINDTGCIESLPMLVRDFSPDYDKLPLFLHNATFSVNWDDEQQFFRSFSSILAALYAVEPPLPGDPQNSKEEYRMVIEHRVLPAMKGGSFWAPSLLLTENALIQLVDVPDLYRIFERC